MNANRKAFLEMIAKCEGTFGHGDEGYNVNVGGTLFTDYSDHPRSLVYIKSIKKKSSAAGRYQILDHIYDHYKLALNLVDFSPASQDAIALQLIRECRALEDIDMGRIPQAIEKCTSRWTSLPNAKYSQPIKTLKFALEAYFTAGGSGLA